jgi:glycosyltransferase involved in cell wall biosynthesis
MKSPLVSVLVPAYNDAQYLPVALGSIEQQTFGDYEVLISDDCSKDATIEIAQTWAGKDSRFKVLHNPQNLGMTQNWNRALNEARGKYVIKLDADDAMRPRCLETLVEELEHNPDIGTAYCRTLSCDENLEPFSSYRGDNAFILNGMDPLRRYVLPGHEWFRMCFSDIQLWHSNAQMHRKESLIELGGWDATWGCASDTDLILRNLEKNNTVLHNPYAGIFYRHRPSSVSDTFRINGWLIVEGLMIHLFSLDRYCRKTSKMPVSLRKAWWRLWQNWNKILPNFLSESHSYPEPQRTNLQRAAFGLYIPPLRIRIEGVVRQILWNIREKLKRALRKQ